MTADYTGTTELYRLRLAVDHGRGVQLEQVPGCQKFYPNWRSAQAAAAAVGGMKRRVVVQSVLVDASGAVVFPEPGRPVKSAGAWRTCRGAGRTQRRHRWRHAPKPSGDGAKTRPTARQPRREPGAPRE